MDLIMGFIIFSNEIYDNGNILIKSHNVSLNNLYCLNVRKWYGREYWFHLQATSDNKILLKLFEDKDRILCPFCHNREIVVQKTNLKKAIDVFLLENDCKEDSFKNNQFVWEKCFSPKCANIIELSYQSNTYRCLKCEKMFRLKSSFLFSEKSHYTKRYVSFLKHYDYYYWFQWNGKNIEKMEERWEYFINSKQVSISYSTYYNLIKKSPDIKLFSFSEMLSEENMLSEFRNLLYVLKPIGII